MLCRRVAKGRVLTLTRLRGGDRPRTPRLFPFLQRRLFVLLIDGMISECGSEFESRIGELERDLGKTSSSILKANEAKTAKPSEMRRLKRKVKSGEGSTVCAIEQAKEAVHTEYHTRLARMADSLDSLGVVHARDLALAGVEGRMHEDGEAPPSPRAEEATLSARRAESVDAEGDFDLIFAGLKSECVPRPSSGEFEGQEPIAEEGGDDVVPNSEGISEDARISAKRQVLGSRIRVLDTMPRDVRDQCVGFRVRPRSNHGFRGCDDFFVLRFPYGFRHDSVPL
ncbi:hypothetical protein DY000_02060063 [Brassica cretica]|uniref:Uncharacterized protein n=1 Tax=Brassica cretica TaxID=69181 RepID=A0ABQ7AUK0_BRACR|nr:hypothetical protein DY000_02060063 [Brassica cretica]